MITLQRGELLAGQLQDQLPGQTVQLRHSHELLVLELGVDRLQLALLSLGEDPGQLADHGDDVPGVVGGVVLEVGGPGGGQGEGGVQQAEAEEECGAGEEGGRDVDHLVLQQRDLYQVLREHSQVGTYWGPH